MNFKRPMLFSKTIFISGVFIFITLLIIITFLLSLFPFSFKNGQNVESEITIIAYSTLTPFLQTSINPVIPTPTIDAKDIIFTKGLKVVIQGTGGEGLRIHQLAGQNSPTIFLANEGDLFMISDGPIITGGYVWWQIKSLMTEEIIGWAAQDFLQVKINTQ